MKKRGEFSGLKWETHCHSVYSNRRRRWFDALNTPREMIESAIRRGLDGMIITDHDTVKGGLAGKKIARGQSAKARTGELLRVYDHAIRTEEVFSDTNAFKKAVRQVRRTFR